MKIQFCWRFIFEILIIHKTSLVSCQVQNEIWPRSVQPFWPQKQVKYTVKLLRKIDDNFANNFLKTKANNKCSAKMYMERATEKHKWVRAVKLKRQAFWHFKVNLVLNLMRLFTISRLNLCEYTCSVETVQQKFTLFSS